MIVPSSELLDPTDPSLDDPDPVVTLSSADDEELLCRDATFGPWCCELDRRLRTWLAAAAAGEFWGAMASLVYLGGTGGGSVELWPPEAPRSLVADDFTADALVRGFILPFGAFFSEDAKLDDGNVLAFSFMATSLGFSALRRYEAKGEEPLVLDRLSAEGESRYRGVLQPESVPPPLPEGMRKSPGVGVAQLSPPEKMSGGATMTSSSSITPPLSLRETVAEGSLSSWIQHRHT